MFNRLVKTKYLVESSRIPRYLQMFKFAENSGFYQFIESDIKRIRDALVREDRIIWALNKAKAWVKLLMANPEEAKKNLLDSSPESKEYEKLKASFRDFKHFFSNAKVNDYKAVSDFRFKNSMSVNDVLTTLRELENQERERTDTSRFLENEGKTLLKFGDGWEWHILDKNYCKKEGAAMRHCGNAGDPRSGDEILSLREPVKKKGKELWKPHATFILNNGMLGEMKGFANSKPTTDLHKYIVPLLKHEVVEGVKGGGYASDQNFSLDDLDEETKNQLLKDKPELMTMKEYFKIHGYDEKVQKWVQTFNPIKVDSSNKDIKIYAVEFASLQDFAENYDKDLLSAIKQVEDHVEYNGDVYSLDHTFEYIFEALKPEEKEKLLTYIKTELAEYAEDNEIDLTEKYIINNIESLLELDELEDLNSSLRLAFYTGHETGISNSYYESIENHVAGLWFLEKEKEEDHILDTKYFGYMTLSYLFDTDFSERHFEELASYFYEIVRNEYTDNRGQRFSFPDNWDVDYDAALDRFRDEFPHF